MVDVKNEAKMMEEKKMDDDESSWMMIHSRR